MRSHPIRLALLSVVLSVLLSVLLSVVGCSRVEQQPQSGERTASGPASSRPSVPSEPTRFARFVPVGDDEGRFEVAVTTYRGPDDARVSLIAAVHIADAAHYRELQELFESYDVLLYELVADPGDRPQPGRDRERTSQSLLGMFQVMLKTGLDLEFQLHAIDYTPDNFVHADLTPAAFRQKMEERGESFLTIFFRLMSREMARQKALREGGEEGETARAPSAFDLVSAFQRREGRHTLRLMFAQQLESIEALAAGAGPGEETVLLEGRNERAVEVLREQLELGRKKLGIYYGAAHMTGIEKSLVDDLGFEKVEQRWLCAWDITKRLDPVRGERGR